MPEVTEQETMLVFGLAALFHAAKLTTHQSSPSQSFKQAREFIIEAKGQGVDLNQLFSEEHERAAR